VTVLKLTDEQKERIWQGQYWGPAGVLTEVRLFYLHSDQGFASSVVMLSTEYSAANRALSDLRRGALRERLSALARLYGSIVRARRLALALVPQVTINTTPDSTEVITTILVKLRCRKAARQVLDKLPWYDLAFRNYVAPHTAAFLIRNAIVCGLAELTHERIGHIEAYAKKAELSGDLRQATRVWRTAYGLKRQLASRERKANLYGRKLAELRSNMERCAEMSDSADQVTKLP
tara:strand:- start:2769 stop:3470 length:702 start_codon:yes stop_codon:yes gene_type:complete